MWTSPGGLSTCQIHGGAGRGTVDGVTAQPIDPKHPVPLPESVETYQRALETASPEAVATVLARIEAGVAHAERTGDFAAVRHVFDSLAMMARLRANPAFLAAVAEAKAADARGDPGVNLVELIERLREKYGDPPFDYGRPT